MNDTNARAAVTVMLAVAVPPIQVLSMCSRCWMSASGISPKRFRKRMKKNTVMRYGRYRRVACSPSTGTSISSRR